MNFNWKSKKLVFFVIFGFWSVGALAIDFTTAGSGKKDNEEAIPSELRETDSCPKHYPLGEPKFKNQQINVRSIWRCYQGFAVQYHIDFKVPLWSAQVINMKEVNKDEFGRVEIFRPDPQVSEKLQASLASYKGSGYDRGHMTPAYDMRFSRQAMDESFYLTNIAPQVGKNFNQGIWAELEAKVRYWSRYRGTLLVVTGPVFLNGTTLGTIGKKDKVQIPTHFFKVIFDLKRNESIAFIMPNQAILTKKSKIKEDSNIYKCAESYCVLENFVTGVSEVERLTQLDFHQKLDKEQKNKAESFDPVGQWFKVK